MKIDNCCNSDVNFNGNNSLENNQKNGKGCDL